MTLNAKQIRLQDNLSKGKSTIGVDIGVSSVNIAQVANYKGKPTLIKTKTVNINAPLGSDKDQETLKALHIAFLDFNSPKAKIACVCSCPKTCVRNVVTPYMPKEELASAVALEIKRSIPFSINDAYMDFNVIEEVVDKGTAKLSINVAVAPKDTVERLLAFFSTVKAKSFSGSISKKFKEEKKIEPLGLKLSGLLPLSLVMENIIEKSKRQVQETLVTIEMGTELTELNIFMNSRMRFSRKIPFAGKDITKSLMQTLMSDKGKVSLTQEEAERIKREYGIPKIEENKLIDDKITTNNILSLIRPKIEQLAKEIERSFDFYREEMHGSKIDRIILFGGGAQLKNLSEFLTKELDLEIIVGNPIEDIDLLFDEVVENEMAAQRLVLAVGAALSSLKGINLLPKEGRVKRKAFIGNAFFVGLAAVVAAALVVVYIGINSYKSGLENKLRKIEQQSSLISSQVAPLQKKVLYSELRRTKHHWDEVLKELSNIVPVNMYVYDLDVKEDSVLIRGTINQDEGFKGASLARFIISMEKGIFNNVKLQNTQKVDATEINFSIKAKID